MKSAVVVGGGYTGLITAYYLAKQGFSIDLYEAGPRLGGMISSERTPHGLVESAANGFILTEELAALLQDLQLDFIKPLPEFRKKRFIFRSGMRRWPLSPLETLSLAFKAGIRFLFRRKAMKPRRFEKVWDWGLRNLGFNTTKFLLSPGLQGIYAGDPRQMSASMILGPLFQAKKSQKGYRGTVSFKGGMQEFIDAMIRKLATLPVKIHLNSKYQITSLSVPHVVCTSAARVSEVLQAIDPASAQALAKVEMVSVLSATVFYEKAEQKIEGFGCLFPEDQGFSALGVLSSTYIFGERGPDYSETWIFGGTRSAKIFERSDLEVLQVIQTERKRLVKGYSEFSEYRIHRWKRGLPHYTPSLEKTLEDLNLPKKLYLNGNYLGGIGLSKILARTQELATKVRYESERGSV